MPWRSHHNSLDMEESKLNETAKKPQSDFWNTQYIHIKSREARFHYLRDVISAHGSAQGGCHSPRATREDRLCRRRYFRTVPCLQTETVFRKLLPDGTYRSKYLEVLSDHKCRSMRRTPSLEGRGTKTGILAARAMYLRTTTPFHSSPRTTSRLLWQVGVRSGRTSTTLPQSTISANTSRFVTK